MEVEVRGGGGVGLCEGWGVGVVRGRREGGGWVRVVLW